MRWRQARASKRPNEFRNARSLRANASRARQAASNTAVEQAFAAFLVEALAHHAHGFDRALLACNVHYRAAVEAISRRVRRVFEIAVLAATRVRRALRLLLDH